MFLSLLEGKDKFIVLACYAFVWSSLFFKFAFFSFFQCSGRRCCEKKRISISETHAPEENQLLFCYDNNTKGFTGNMIVFFQDVFINDF